MSKFQGFGSEPRKAKKPEGTRITYLPNLAKHDKTLIELNERFLDESGRIRLLPSSAYQEIDPILLRAWCCTSSRYGIPTIELIDWLKEIIGSRTAIEVAAGNGDLGWHLGILSTDSYLQTSEAIQQIYEGMAQATTKPTPDVEKCEAVAAVKKHKPEVVIASWLTQKKRGDSDGNPFGAEEERILKCCKTYIHIGNAVVHGSKRILDQRHKSYYFPWLVSRAEFPDQNVIYVWNS